MVYYSLAELSYETKITQPHLFNIRHSDKISMVYIFNSICAKTMVIHIMNKFKAIYRIRQNFCGWYANDHSRENFCGCTTASCCVLRESYRITYSTKIRGKIFAIECKTVKTTKVFHSKVLPYMLLNFDI